jgi:hypothetical protein
MIQLLGEKGKQVGEKLWIARAYKVQKLLAILMDSRSL